ncbi:hypothetical protein vseg_002019 [Gypsophila vaccaria]
MDVENRGPSEQHNNEPLLQLEEDDVIEEIKYWKNAVVCFILGANPPWEVLEGFVRRIWSKFNIDNISFLLNGVFLVRFHSNDMLERVLQSGHYLFDNKPMIVKPWTKDMELKKTTVQSVPVWIQLHDLPIKFWGKSLPKISGLLGKYIKTDGATEKRTKLGFARVMVEMTVEHKCPETVKFKDEMGVTLQVAVTYEWKPISCSFCSAMGHHQTECRKGAAMKPKEKPKMEWRPVNKQKQNPTVPEMGVIKHKEPDPKSHTQKEGEEQGG